MWDPAISLCGRFCFAYVCGQLFDVCQIPAKDFVEKRFSRALPGHAEISEPLFEGGGELDRHVSNLCRGFERVNDGAGLFLLDGEALLRVAEAAHPVEGTGFAEDDQAFKQRRRLRGAGENSAQQHKVFLDAPLLCFADLT